MKKILSGVFILLLCVMLVGCIFVATQSGTDKPPNSTQSGTVDSGGSDVGNSTDSPNDGDLSSSKPNEDSSSSGTQGDSSDTGNSTTPELPDVPNDETPDDNGLKDPANVNSYIQDGLEMMAGASVYLGDEEYEPAIRFTGFVSSALKAEMDANSQKSLAFLIAPMEYFDAVNPNNYTYMDWVTEFNKAGKTVLYSQVEENNFYENGNDYMVRFRLQNVMYKNINRKFVCLVVVATNNGSTTSYKYSSLPEGVDYRSNARSIAYVSAAALNAHTLGMESFSNAEVTRLKAYINQSVDVANGKETATDDGSMYAFSTNISAPQKMSVGQSFKVTTTISPDVDVPVWYRSSDEGVIQVDADGKVTAKAKGTAVVGVYVAGESYGITVTVS